MPESMATLQTLRDVRVSRLAWWRCHAVNAKSLCAVVTLRKLIFAAIVRTRTIDDSASMFVDELERVPIK
jgi:hypothetical protein